MIDCDIHPQISDPEALLAYIEPGQRDWFRAQGPGLGLPGYSWTHPVGWFRADLETANGNLPGGSVDSIRRELLDPFGIDAGVLNADDAVTVSLMPSPYRAAAFARAHNEWIRERWLEAEPRFRGAIICPAQDPEEAAKEIRRVAEDERFAHVLLVGGSERPYGEPRYLPIFEAAAECGLPVAIHSGGEGMGIAAPPGGAGPSTFYIEWHTLGSACSTMAHLVSLLCHGTFERLPNLRVLLMEGGVAWLPGILWRLDTNWRGLREEVPWLTRKPSEVAADHVRFSTQPLEHTDGNDELLFEMLAAAGAPDNLCFASDYPHWDFDDPKFMVNRLPDSWRDAVLHDNAAELYGERLGLVRT
ncbi:MAG: amidohydrolase [Actinobacteria bacterium]|nr:MAG: amidohydrolase [Actinomycetota bacterium]